MSSSNGDSFGLSVRDTRFLNSFRLQYNGMPPDPHLFNGEGERFRRYGRFAIDPSLRTVELFEHDTFFQAKKFDQLYGNLHRNFAAMTREDYENPFFIRLLIDSFQALPIPAHLKSEIFEISAHMIRIESTPTSSVGRPAPEGIHRDGYHFGSIHLMRRENLSGAENNVYDLEKKRIDTVTLSEPMDSIYFDDAAIFHGVSPFERIREDRRGSRDMLILLYQPLSESPQKDASRKRIGHY